MHSKSVLVSLRYVANVLSCSVTNSFLQQHVSPFFKAFFCFLQSFLLLGHLVCGYRKWVPCKWDIAE